MPPKNRRSYTHTTESPPHSHRGKLVYECYSGVFKADGQHIAQSVTKSFFGTIAAALVAEGKLDEQAKVSHYVPELADSGFGNATVRDVMDMRTGIQYSENYTDPKAEIWAHARSGGIDPSSLPAYDAVAQHLMENPR